MEAVTGLAAGVPYLLVPPTGPPRSDTPVVIAWHLLDAPRSETAFAAALPMRGLDAWRVYLGLPLTGRRGLSMDEVMSRARVDVVANLYEPIAFGAVAEFPAAFGALRSEFGIGDGPLGLLGGSLGAAIAQLVLLEHEVTASAVVLVSPLIRLTDAIVAGGRAFGFDYAWTDAARATAARMDFVRRSAEYDAVGQPPVHIVVGNDDVDFRASAQDLYHALAHRYADSTRCAITQIDGMGHALAEEPGIDPAPQTPHAAQADEFVGAWFGDHLTGRI